MKFWGLRGFSDKFIHMIKQITQNGSVGVKVNEVEGISS
jgi:hypothetical protein